MATTMEQAIAATHAKALANNGILAYEIETYGFHGRHAFGIGAEKHWLPYGHQCFTTLKQAENQVKRLIMVWGYSSTAVRIVEIKI